MLASGQVWPLTVPNDEGAGFWPGLAINGSERDDGVVEDTLATPASASVCVTLVLPPQQVIFLTALFSNIHSLPTECISDLILMNCLMSPLKIGSALLVLFSTIPMRSSNF